MLEELTQDIMSAKEDLRRKRDVESSLDSARRSLRRQREKLWELEARLSVERADVEALEALSLRGLFHTILGDKEEQVKKERQDVLAAKLRYDESREAVTALEEEIAQLQRQLEQLGDVEARYHGLLRRKEQILRRSDGATASRLLELSEAQADARSDVREVQEAISAGGAVLSSLDSALSALQGAETWGTVDLLGGGMLTTAAKHGRVDEARRWTHRAQQDLRRFRRELDDLRSDISIGIDVGGFETFADYVFDGLIIDWVVQSRIESALSRTTEMRRRVDTTLTALRRELQQTRERATRIERQRRELIEQA